VNRVRLADESGVERLAGTIELPDGITTQPGLVGANGATGGHGAQVQALDGSDANGGTAALVGGDSAGSTHAGAAVLVEGATATDAGTVKVLTGNTRGGPGQALVSDGTNAHSVEWGGAIVGSGAPVVQPNGRLPIYVDTTAVTGGIYIFANAAWVKAASI
jgi:hypothetical protein